MKANEVVRNGVKEKLARNEVVASMTIRLVRGVEIARMAKTAGFDMIYIDLEHSTLTLEATGQVCLAALGAGVAQAQDPWSQPAAGRCSTIPSCRTVRCEGQAMTHRQRSELVDLIAVPRPTSRMSIRS